MKFKFWTKIVLAFMVLTLVGGCIFLPQKPGYVRIAVYSGDPNNPSATVGLMETLFVGISGLEAYAQYTVEIRYSDDSLVAKYILNATGDGKLPPTAMWPDAGIPLKDTGPTNPNEDIQVGSYKIILTGNDDSTNVTFPFSVISRTTPAVWSSDISGGVTNGYLEGEIVYATGMKFVANSNVDIYIMRDRDTWNYGDILNDSTNDFVKPVKVVTDVPIDGNGKLNWVNLGPATIDTAHGNCNNFDIIVDANQDGIFDPKDAVDSKNAAGFTVQRAFNPVYLTMQLASNGHALDYMTHWNDQFYYPNTFNQDGSDTGFPWEGFGKGVFCILNPLIDETNIGTGLVYWQQVQIWVIRATDFNNLASSGNNLQGLDVSDSQGRPDLVWVQRTCSNGAGSILIWQAPLVDRRVGTGTPVQEDEGFVVIVEKPDQYGAFDNVYDSNNDYVDGVLNPAVAGDPPITGGAGFSVDNVMQ